MINASSAEYPKQKHRKRVDQSDPDIDIPDGDVEQGKKLYNNICNDCHRLNLDCYLGPSLGKIYNARAGSRKGYMKDYSLALRSASFKWTDQKLYKFLQDPDQVVPGNVMIFQGMSDTWQIACIIEYLKYVKSIGGSDEF